MRDTGLINLPAFLPDQDLSAITDSLTGGDYYLGWTQGNTNSEVEMEVIFDYMCPHSKSGVATMPLDSDSKLLEAVTLKMVPFPYDMHKHSHEIDQVFFFFKDWCEKDSDECHFNDYMEFAFESQDEFYARSENDYATFTDWWA